jgi:hypothetical protein
VNRTTGFTRRAGYVLLGAFLLVAVLTGRPNDAAGSGSARPRDQQERFSENGESEELKYSSSLTKPRFGRLGKAQKYRQGGKTR